MILSTGEDLRTNSIQSFPLSNLYKLKQREYEVIPTINHTLEPISKFLNINILSRIFPISLTIKLLNTFSRKTSDFTNYNIS